MKRILSFVLAVFLLVGCGSFTNTNNDLQQEQNNYDAGTYTAKAMGMDDDIEVIVTLAEDKIQSIEIGEQNETSGICEKV